MKLKRYSLNPGISITLAVVILASCAVPAVAQTKRPITKATAAKKHGVEMKYKAQCGMTYSAAEAKKNRYICPMDHKPLVKIVRESKR